MKTIKKLLVPLLFVGMLLTSAYTISTTQYDERNTYQDSIVHLTADCGNDTILEGTAFFVEGNYIITAAHCLMKPNNTNVETAYIYFSFYKDGKIVNSRYEACEVLAVDLTHDTAIVMGTTWTAKRAKPLEMGSCEIDDVTVVGYPNIGLVSTDDDINKTITAQYMDQTSVYLESYYGYTWETPDVYVFSTNDKVASGMSGAPIMTDEQVVGIFSGSYHGHTKFTAVNIEHAMSMIDEIETEESAA